MKKSFLFSCFVISMLPSFAQVNPCATHDLYLQNAANHPAYQTMVQNTFEEARQWAEANGFSKTGGVYQIPVVVHIVHTAPEQNLPDSIVYSQIAVLNEDFRRMNADTLNTRNEFLPIAADAEIEFFLATLDPDGNPTNGITRTAGSPGGFGTYTPFDDNVKFDTTGGKDAWPTNRYLNIWVCDILFGFGILGYAYPPIGNVPNWDTTVTPADPGKQGVVIHWTVFGNNNPNATGFYAITNKGRTTTHEVGHFLGLRHIWGDGDCTMDDGISDTPDATDNAGQVCDWNKNTCTESAGPQLPDNIENYMDYAADSCMNMFTQGQVAIMRYILENFRQELVGLPVGLPQHVLEGKVFVYPNPAENILFIKFADEMTIEGGMIYDMLGHAVRRVNAGEQTVDISGFSSGVYSLVLSTNKGTVTKKILKK